MTSSLSLVTAASSSSSLVTLAAPSQSSIQISRDSIPPSNLDNPQLSYASKQAMLKAMQQELQNEMQERIKDATRKGKEAVFALLSDRTLDISGSSECLFSWALYEDEDSLIRLVQDGRLNLSFFDTKLFQVCDRKWFSALRLILPNTRISPDSSLIEWAMSEGVEDVKLVISHPHFDPEPYSYSMLEWALKGQHHDVWVLLLIHPKVSNEHKQLTFVQACGKGDLRAVTLFLNLPSLQPPQDALIHAAISGHHEVVKLLLTRLNPAEDDQKALRVARNGATAKVLLADPRVDPRTGNNYPLLMACMHGKADVVKVLLDDGRADPAKDLGACLVWAHGGGHESVVALLMQDPRANPNRHITYDNWFQDPSRVQNCTFSPLIQITIQPPNTDDAKQSLS